MQVLNWKQGSQWERDWSYSDDGGGGCLPAMQVASRSGKGKEMDFPLESPKGAQPCRYLDFSQWEPYWNSDLQTQKRTKMLLVWSHCIHDNLLTAAWGEAAVVINTRRRAPLWGSEHCQVVEGENPPHGEKQGSCWQDLQGSLHYHQYHSLQNLCSFLFSCISAILKIRQP